MSKERAYEQAIALFTDTPAPMDTPVSLLTPTSPPTPTPKTCSENVAADAYCMELGSGCEVRSGEDGGEIGVCI
jgi:putative hemolysin